jgi:XTP/dITP diphosphohydrolase
MCEIVLAVATGNQHKIQEIEAVLGPLGARVLTAAEAGAPADFSPVEDGATFEENSRIKAAALTRILESGAHGAAVDAVIADDSGLCVDALGGAPGVYSARFADMDADGPGPDEGLSLRKKNALRPCASGDKDDSDASPDSRNNAKLLALLDDVPREERTARFVCVITLLALRGGKLDKPGARDIVCRGECEGHIIRAPRGDSGFGYDPVFAPLTTADAPERAPTFAEMTPDGKNAISHRARALAKLHDVLSEYA